MKPTKFSMIVDGLFAAITMIIIGAVCYLALIY